MLSQQNQKVENSKEKCNRVHVADHEGEEKVEEALSHSEDDGDNSHTKLAKWKQISKSRDG